MLRSEFRIATLVTVLTLAATTATANQDNYFTGNMRIGAGSMDPIALPCPEPPAVPVGTTECERVVSVWEIFHNSADSPGGLILSYYAHDFYKNPGDNEWYWFNVGPLQYWTLMLDLMTVASRMPDSCRYDGDNTVAGRADGVAMTDYLALLWQFGNLPCTLPTAQNPPM